MPATAKLVLAPWLLRRRLRGADDIVRFPGLREAALVTIDVFDTALVRTLRHHDDVFALAAWRAIARHGLPGDIAALAAARREAHRRALASAAAAGRAETTIDEIYARHESADATTRAALLAEELATERDVCRANPAILALFDDLVAQGVRVAFLSDTPFAADFVRGLLRDAGYAGDLEVYASSAFGTTKAHGDLFRRVIEAAGVDGGAVWHIGDNLRSDVIRARRHGIQPVWYRPILRKPHPAPAPATAAGIARSVTDGTRAVLAARDLPALGHIGATIAGPVYLAFVQWLTARLRQAPVERVLFLARDAYPLMRVYERLCDPERDPPFTYLVVSRRSLVVPLIERLGDAELDVLLSHERPLPVANFLARIGIDPAPHAAAAASVGLRLDQVVATPDERAALRALFLALEPVVLERTGAERALLLRYLAQEGFAPDRALAMCDVGWNGKSQRALAKLLGADGRLDGYYVGTSKILHRLGALGGAACGWLAEDGAPRFGVDISNLSWVLLELVFSEPQASVIRYAETSDGRVAPVFRAEPMDAGFQAAVAEMQAGAFAFLDAYARAFGGLPPLAIDERAAVAELTRLVAQPTCAEADALGDIVMIEGLGETTTGYAIAAKPGWRAALRDPRTLLAAYRATLWRRGFTVRALRSAFLTNALYGGLERLKALRSRGRASPAPGATQDAVLQAGA